MVEKILEKATELFTRQGFKMVTMDEIAAAMGISKKTIYQYYTNKNILVEKCAESIANKIIQEIDVIYSRNNNPIEELLLVRRTVARLFSDEKTAGLQQLKKYYPEIHYKLKNNQTCRMEFWLRNNITRGIELGLYREDVDIAFIIKIHHNTMSFLIEDEELYKDVITFNNYQDKYLDYHIRGIGTEKGIKLLNELKQNLHEK